MGQAGTVSRDPGSPNGRLPGVRVDLYWIPLGAGATVIRVSGKLYEGLVAAVRRRPQCNLYHSALIASVGDHEIVIEMAPVPDGRGRHERGVVGEGPVGSRLLRRLRVFRYEIRCWPGGVIPDLSHAVASPVRVSEDPAIVQNVVDLVPLVPTLVWGRDEIRAGEMWNSNSVVSWVLTRAGVDAAAGRPPGGGRAPGWDAGIVAARAGRRQLSDTS